MQSVELQLAIAATLPAGYLCQDTKKVQSCRYLSIPSHVYVDATIRWGKNCDDCSAGFQNYSPCWVFLVCSSQYPAKVDQRNTRGLTVAWVSDTRQLAQRPKKNVHTGSDREVSESSQGGDRCVVLNVTRTVDAYLTWWEYDSSSAGNRWVLPSMWGPPTYAPSLIMVGAPCYKAMVGHNNEFGVLTWPQGPPRCQVFYIQVSDNTFRGQDQGCFHSKIGASIRKEAD